MIKTFTPLACLEMIMKLSFNKLLNPIFALAIIMMPATLLHAAPGTLANSPLFTTNSVEPNVFFEVDDSGSMDWEILTTNYWHICAYTDAGSDTCGWLIDNGLYRDHTGISYQYFEYLFDNNDDAYSNSCDDSLRTLELCSAAVQSSDWRVKSPAVNVLYYNPAISYSPWKNADGSLMAAASFSTVKSDPQIASAGYSETRDLAGLVYNVWRDTHGFTGVRPTSQTVNQTTGSNSIVDWWDQHTRYTVNTSTITIENITATGNTEAVIATITLTGTGPHTELSGRTIAEEQQNIANWYQYSRRRSFVAKSAIADVVSNNSSYRYGLNFINNHSFPYNSGTSTLIELPSGNGTVTHNNDLLTSLNLLDWPASGTPLRQGLERAGRYYDDDLSGYSDPISEQCQQSFTVLFTDGYWNGSDPDSAISDADGDGESITVADVAKYYYDKDLSPLADNLVGSIFDTAEHQHMVTYTVAFGVKGHLVDTDNDGWPGNAPGLSESDAWGTLPFDNKEKIDDLWHSAFNSKGTFVSAATPGDVSDAMKDALSNISDRIGSAASVAFNTTTLTGSSAVYLAQFNSSNNKWSGDLLSFPLDSITGSVSSSFNWTAATVLEARSNPESTRKIFTYNGSDGVPFTWDNLTTGQQADLRINPDNSVESDVNAPIAKARLAFLRGDDTNEADNSGTYSFRIRSKLLGDIIHSDPVFVGSPELSWPDTSPFPSVSGTTYDDFKAGARTEIVYVGSNDGMLHAFNASDGSEEFAFIANSFFSSTLATEGLHYLTDPNYTHRYYADMPSTVSDVYIDTGAGDAWHTVLIGGGRAGGKGLFALNITDPSQFIEDTAHAANLVLWEFDDSDDADMGFTYSKPSIAMMNNDRWAAIFGNGYNSTGDGTASLFIVFLDGGLDGTWTLGSDYIKITTEVGSIVSNNCSNASSDCNGLSTPQIVDMDGDSVVDRIYAGDLKGNMWVFDVTGNDPAGWDSAYKTNTPKPLFTASHSSTVQPITNRPILAIHPSSLGGDPDVLVFFGTGQYLTSGDISNTETQSFYGVWDNGAHSLTPTDLVEQTFLNLAFQDESDVNISSQIRVLTDNAVDYAGADNGWVINLTIDSGERVIVDPDLRGDLVFFNTWIPDSNPCNAGGSGVLMSVKQLNGGRPDTPAFDLNNSGTVDSSDYVFVTNSDGSIDSYAPSGERFSEGLPASSSFLSNKQYTPGTDGGSTIDERDVEDLSAENSGRVSWQELMK